MRRALGLVLGLVLLSVASLSGADFWEKKKFTQWNVKEVQKMLNDSPWAKEKTFSQVFASDLNAPARTPQTGTGGPPGAASPIDQGERPSLNDDDSARRDTQANPRLTYTGLLLSSLPIRQARVRAVQLREDYDRMTAEQRQEFDRQAEQFLGARFEDEVILQVTYASNIFSDARDLNGYWQSQTVDRLHTTTYLIGTDGRRVELKRYVPPQGGNQVFQLVFPREVNGTPVVTAKDKHLRFEFTHPDIRNQGEKTVLLEFRPNKMILDGQLEY